MYLLYTKKVSTNVRKDSAAHKKARGCTASGRTASYFYIISTWRPRYYGPPSSSSASDRYFLPKPAVFLETAATRRSILRVTRSLSLSPSDDAVSCFLEASHGIHTSEAWLRPLPVVPVRYTPLCAGVYPIRAILILIKSAERIVWA